MPDSQPAIFVEGLTKRFGDVLALDELSFTVTPGELFFLLGPSGCGKSTCLRILAGLETPDSGHLRFSGQDLADRPPHTRGAPMVFQNYALWPHLSLMENVAFGLREQGVPATEITSRVAQALDMVGLAGLESRSPGQLSGGQQQRVALARALVVNPKIILLDEPLSNLDAKLRAEMRQEIERLHADTDITFVYVTHDQTEALSLADRMAVMHRGRISALGTPTDLYHHPPNRFCAEFLGEINLIPARVLNRDGAWTALETPLGLWRGHSPTPPLAAGADVLCALRPEAMHLAESEDEHNTLRATIRSLRLTGSTINVDLRANDQAIRVTMLSAPGLSLRPGQEVTLSVRPEAATILPANAE